jgi:hypothetical protein
VSQFSRPPTSSVPRNLFPATENGVCSLMPELATTPGLPDTVEPSAVDSWKLRSRYLCGSRRDTSSPASGPETQDYGPKRLPQTAELNSSPILPMSRPMSSCESTFLRPREQLFLRQGSTPCLKRGLETREKFRSPTRGVGAEPGELDPTVGSLVMPPGRFVRKTQYQSYVPYIPQLSKSKEY